MDPEKDSHTSEEARASLEDQADVAYLKYLRERSLHVRNEVYGTLPRRAVQIACWAVCLAATAIDLMACVQWGHRFFAYPADVGDVSQGLVLGMFVMFAVLAVFLYGLFAEVHHRTWGIDRNKACMDELDEILHKVELHELKMRVKRLEEGKTGGKEEKDDVRQS